MTRDGESVRIMCTDYYGEKPIIAKMEESEYSYSFYEDGRFLSFGESSDCDLFFAPEKHAGWVNVYKGGDRDYFTLGAMIYDRKEDAERCRVEDCVATTKIEWEE